MHTLNDYTIHDFNVYNKAIISIYIYILQAAWMHSEQNSCVALCIATYIFLALIPCADLYK